ncbi:hypothetical protein QTP81_03125 [Alteromonas sp. ASW11-36]|uniref:STAS/SEC14 domain-containing protein n=1 Tax=Alteromonas arenosi TaxID=3055817 RepID=A0ABT7STT0_9ALTE|nr:hypothetical protein [Alteromonas sp. ASW11-36]MDM7859598.1 hypothetical protein [Alteromonas sp. ASW11-36]
MSGSALIIEGTGPANIEAVQIYQERAQRFRDMLKEAPWASLVLLRGEPLLPPEAKRMLIEIIRYASTQNLVATGVVLQDLPHVKTIRHFWTSIYDETTLPYQFFDNEEQARAWLYAQITAAQ